MQSAVVYIEKPIHIPAAIYETLFRASRSELHVFFLHGQTPNIARGASQPFSNNPGCVTDNGYVRDDGVTEVRRPDGGLSWYHPDTICMMHAFPHVDRAQINRVQHQWGDEIKKTFSNFGDVRNLVYHKSDLYVDSHDGQQIVGMSGASKRMSDLSNDTIAYVARAGWYERDPLDSIAHLLEKDSIPVDAFRRKLALTPEGLHQHAVRSVGCSLDDVVSSSDFVSENSLALAKQLQHKKIKFPSRALIGSCILGSVYPYSFKMI